jgi:hypothetical protein
MLNVNICYLEETRGARGNPEDEACWPAFSGKANNNLQNKIIICKICGFHGGDYEEWCLLGCYAVWLL